MAGYTCTDPDAYGAVCAFAVLIFLVQVGFTVTLYTWKSDFIVEPGLYDDIPQNSSHTASGFTYAAPPMNPPHYVHPTATSADL